MPPEVSQFILESIFSMGSSWRILGFHGLNEAQGTSSYLAHSDVDSCQKDRHQYLVWCIYWKEKVVKWITWLDLIGVWVSSTLLQAHIWWCRVKCAIWIITYEVHGWYESSWSGFEYFEQEFIRWHFFANANCCVIFNSVCWNALGPMFAVKFELFVPWICRFKVIMIHYAWLYYRDYRVCRRASWQGPHTVGRPRSAGSASGRPPLPPAQRNSKHSKHSRRGNMAWGTGPSWLLTQRSYILWILQC